MGERYLVLEIDWRIEMGHFRVGRLDHHLAFAGVDELAHLEDGGRWPHITLLEAAASCAPSLVN